jgi:hypothetical protein
MKSLHGAILFLFSFLHSYAQGELFFSTRNPAAGVNAPVDVWEAELGPYHYPGPQCSAQLYIVNGSTLTPVPGSLTTFQPPGSGGAQILARYVVPVTVQFPGIPIGSPVTVRMRAWATAAGSYQNASVTEYADGESFNLIIPALGGGVNPPADLPVSFTGFTMFGIIPEPSTWTMIALGVLILSYSRYKKQN